MDRKEAAETLALMMSGYSRIRKNEMEWEAVTMAIEALQEKDHRCANCGNGDFSGVMIYCLLHSSVHRLDEYCSEWEEE